MQQKNTDSILIIFVLCSAGQKKPPEKCQHVRPPTSSFMTFAPGHMFTREQMSELYPADKALTEKTRQRSLGGLLKAMTLDFDNELPLY